mmetsp:Transcript_13538/g.29228  ORF Transcript_13538/g.29228 Transcript_13538/m.29228 type:complete len:135 (+) Transcript_13538:52-456(+)
MYPSSRKNQLAVCTGNLQSDNNTAFWDTKMGSQNNHFGGLYGTLRVWHPCCFWDTDIGSQNNQYGDLHGIRQRINKNHTQKMKNIDDNKGPMTKDQGQKQRKELFCSMITLLLLGHVPELSIESIDSLYRDLAV